MGSSTRVLNAPFADVPMPGRSAAAGFTRTARRWDIDQGFPPACSVSRGERHGREAVPGPTRCRGRAARSGAGWGTPRRGRNRLGPATYPRLRATGQAARIDPACQHHDRRGAHHLLLERGDRRDHLRPVWQPSRRCLRPCSATYKRDAWGLITAGLAGGKGIPASVADHPCTFATLTAPSFGPVHGIRQKGPCRARRDHPVCPARAASVVRQAAPR